MNYDSMTSKELINYLDLHNTDPLVRRLITLLRDESLMEELEDAGMDPVTKTFEDGWETYTPSEYIYHLRSDVDYYKQDAETWEAQHEQAKQECEKLKARSVAELLHEMEREVRNHYATVQQNYRDINQLIKEKEELTHKLDMWAILNR